MGPPRGAHALRRAGVPGAARPAPRVVGRPGGQPSTTPASTLDGVRLGAGEVGGWLDAHAGRGRPHRRAPCRARGVPAPARCAALALATADGQAAWVDATEITPEDDAALTTWLADPARPKVLHDAKGPMLALARARLAAPRAGQRHRAVGLPRPPRPALLRPRRPHGALPQARAQAGLDRRATGQLSLDGLEARRRRRRHRDAPRPGGARPGRRARRGDRGARRHRPARRRRAAAGRPARRHGADRHRGRHRPPRGARDPLRERGARRRRGGLPRDRQGDQPRLAQAAPGGALRRARRCRRPSAPRPATRPTPTRCRRSTRRPSTRSCWHLLRHRDVTRLRQTIEGLLKTVPVRRPDPHDVQPDDRGDRPALEHRPQPAEHPGPHRGGPPDPRGLRRRARASSA